MPENSFDIVSKIDLNEVTNAIQQALKEITVRYDLKDSKSSIELNEKDKKIQLASADEYKLRAVTEVLEGRLVKRGVPLKGLVRRRSDPRRRLDRAPGDLDPAGHPDREGARNRQEDQGQPRSRCRPRSRAIWCG